jgi:hypothetical protein
MYDEKRGLTPRVQDWKAWRKRGLTPTVQVWESRGQTKNFANHFPAASIVPKILL